MSRNHQNSHLTSSLLTSIGCSSLSLATFSAEVTDSRGKVKQLYADLSQLLTDCFYVLVISVMIILNGNIYMVITDCKFLCCFWELPRLGSSRDVSSQPHFGDPSIIGSKKLGFHQQTCAMQVVWILYNIYI